MSTLADAALVAVALSNFGLLAQRNLRGSLRLLALQGFAVGALVVLLDGEGGARTVLLALGVAGLKGAVYPRVLAGVLRKLKIESEDRPLLGPSASLVAGLVALGLAFAVAPRLTPPGPPPPSLALPVALATMITGLALIVTRRAALAQVYGYVVLENGIFLFALVLVGGLPLLLEFGGLLEVFFAVFVMGIAVDRISREFATMDVEALGLLRG